MKDPLKLNQHYIKLAEKYKKNISYNNVLLKNECVNALKTCQKETEFIYLFWLDILNKNIVVDVLESKNNIANQYKEQFPLGLNQLS